MVLPAVGTKGESGLPNSSTFWGTLASGVPFAILFVDNTNQMSIDTNRALAALIFPTTKIMMTHLPVADPHVVGQLWANAGVVTVSAG